jgi:hypothetical protein
VTHARMIPTAYKSFWMMRAEGKQRRAHLCWVNPVYYPCMYISGCTSEMFSLNLMVPHDGSRSKCKVCLALEAERDARLAERFPGSAA